VPDPTYRPGPLAAVHRAAPPPGTGAWTLVFVRELRHPVDRVWAALTEPDQLRRWAPYAPDRDLAAPGEVTLAMRDGHGGETPVTGTVTACEPPRLLEHAFGEDVLRWELEPTAGGTRLTLRHTSGAEPGFASSAAAGWHLCLDVADALLAGTPCGPVVGERAREYGWAELNDRYAEVLGAGSAAGQP
jgi:uncharacterized protein YndB with AHSA1/START domain